MPTPHRHSVWMDIPTACTALALLCAAPTAAAQMVGTYCDGALTVHATYATIQSNGRSAQVLYHQLLQNTDPHLRTLVGILQHVSVVDGIRVQNLTNSITLNAGQQKNVQLLTIAISNPSGTGAPAPDTVAKTVRYSCRFQ